MEHKLQEAIGVYQRRMRNSLNPLSWIQTFLFFPKHALSYLGISPSDKASNILSVFWWLFLLVAEFAGNEILSAIKQLILANGQK